MLQVSFFERGGFPFFRVSWINVTVFLLGKGTVFLLPGLGWIIITVFSLGKGESFLSARIRLGCYKFPSAFTVIGLDWKISYCFFLGKGGVLMCQDWDG